MYICICNAITEKQLKQALDNGAQNLHELQNTLGIGNRCGSCREHARSLIQNHQSDQHGQNSKPCEHPLTHIATI